MKKKTSAVDLTQHDDESSNFEDDSEDERDSPACGVIFMDSLRCHRMKTITKNIRLWLNDQYHRLQIKRAQDAAAKKKARRMSGNSSKGNRINKKEKTEKGKKRSKLKLQRKSDVDKSDDVGYDDDESDVEVDIDSIESVELYKTSNFKNHAPRVPYQTNCCDCGVFACRYAWGLYQQRNEVIMESDLKNKLVEIITNSRFFEFGMEDIATMRKTMKKLVDSLTSEYAPVMEQERKKRIQERKKKKKEKEEKKMEEVEEGREEEGGAEKGKKKIKS